MSLRTAELELLDVTDKNLLEYVSGPSSPHMLRIVDRALQGYVGEQERVLKKMMERVKTQFHLRFIPSVFLQQKPGAAFRDMRYTDGSATVPISLVIPYAEVFDEKKRMVGLIDAYHKMLDVLVGAEKTVLYHFLRSGTILSIEREAVFDNTTALWNWVRGLPEMPSVMWTGRIPFRIITGPLVDTEETPVGFGLNWFQVPSDGLGSIASNGYFGAQYGMKCYTDVSRYPFLRTLKDHDWFFATRNAGWYHVTWNEEHVSGDRKGMEALSVKLDLELGPLPKV